ncbi:MAG TPA: TraR/DksA C4-type zinc finger protein [Kiritimatiellia bacterium]|nr:TraR/DksA C4-type zinc finger protein [Kiritimatiellia bacterium]
MAQKKKAAKPAKKAVKPAKKPSPARKPARPAPKPVKKAARPAAKPAPKASAKTAAKAPVAAKPASRLAPPRPLLPVRPPPVLRGAMAMTKRLTAKDLAMFKDLLLKLRDRVIDEIKFLSHDNLNRSQRDSAGDLSSYSFHMADQGTDNFDREFAANLLSSEQDVLYEIDEALRRIDGGTFGICESTGQPIEYERLKVLPFARYCVAAQTEMERGKPRFRPFKRTSIQTIEAQT